MRPTASGMMCYHHDLEERDHDDLVIEARHALRAISDVERQLLQFSVDHWLMGVRFGRADAGDADLIFGALSIEHSKKHVTITIAFRLVGIEYVTKSGGMGLNSNNEPQASDGGSGTLTCSRTWHADA